MCFAPPPMPVAPATPATPATPVQAIDQNKAFASSRSQASGTQQVATGQGAGSTMLTSSAGIDPSSLELGRKSLLGG